MTFHFSWSVLTLIVIGVAVAYSFWKAHRDPTFVQFNVFDLIMFHGRLDKIAVVFMAVFVITAWVFIGLYLDGKMTEGYMTTFGVMWVTPIVAKVVFGANSTQGMAVPGQQQNQYQPYQQNGAPPPGAIVDGVPVPAQGQGAQP